MNRRKEIAKYVVADYLTAAVTWALFWAFRKLYIESHKFGIDVPFTADAKFYLSALLIIPAFWLFLYTMFGLYATVFHKSRIAEVKQLFLATTTGVVILFFSLLLNDVVIDYKSHYMAVS